ncbi:ribosome biogenesis protein slx9-like [Xenia sp. Carnegie-2017]|uniref:ribosome biogenesis protein slx9-like n=1 Tax=Xenia sp. Carnegie-2017 TaxID=2897299 RepID=UPI001F04E8C3|nr:ribosome biogenesis protein slx9-like [Xenia sp. Carnegie-2017]
MGKIRRTRTKRHIEAIKRPSNSESCNFDPNESGLPALFSINNLFQVSCDETKKVEKPMQESSNAKVVQKEVSTCNKNEKRKSRHEEFLKKLEASKVKEKNLIATRKREKTVITGDLNPLTQALLEINKIPVTKPDKKRRKNKRRKKTSSQQKRLNSQLSDMETFQKVLDHPVFKSSPLETISEHVCNMIQCEKDV